MARLIPHGRLVSQNKCHPAEHGLRLGGVDWHHPVKFGQQTSFSALLAIRITVTALLACTIGHDLGILGNFGRHSGPLERIHSLIVPALLLYEHTLAKIRRAVSKAKFFTRPGIPVGICLPCFGGRCASGKHRAD
jgi:4-hydroxybenzoate polyprenyltransferase